MHGFQIDSRRPHRKIPLYRSPPFHGGQRSRWDHFLSPPTTRLPPHFNVSRHLFPQNLWEIFLRTDIRGPLRTSVITRPIEKRKLRDDEISGGSARVGELSFVKTKEKKKYLVIYKSIFLIDWLTNKLSTTYPISYLTELSKWLT